MKLENVKKFLHGCRVAKTALICILGVPMFFVFSEVPANFIGSFLHVDPTYTGGLVAEEIVDPIGNASEKGGLVCYTVHQPVTGARWQKSSEYWQVVFNYNGAAAQKNSVVYIAADNMARGGQDWNFVRLLFTWGFSSINDGCQRILIVIFRYFCFVAISVLHLNDNDQKY